MSPDSTTPFVHSAQPQPVRSPSFQLGLNTKEMNSGDYVVTTPGFNGEATSPTSAQSGAAKAPLKRTRSLMQRLRAMVSLVRSVVVPDTLTVVLHFCCRGIARTCQRIHISTMVSDQPRLSLPTLKNRWASKVPCRRVMKARELRLQRALINPRRVHPQEDAIRS